jgi:hypothetical protein
MAHNNLMSSSNILNNTAGLVFMGTPHRGANAAKWASTLKGLLNIFGVGPSTDLLTDLVRQSRTLMQINSDFVGRVPDIQQILSFYEMHKTKGLNALVRANQVGILRNC